MRFKLPNLFLVNLRQSDHGDLSAYDLDICLDPCHRDHTDDVCKLSHELSRWVVSCSFLCAFFLIALCTAGSGTLHWKLVKCLVVLSPAPTLPYMRNGHLQIRHIPASSGSVRKVSLTASLAVAPLIVSTCGPKRGTMPETSCPPASTC